MSGSKAKTAAKDKTIQSDKQPQFKKVDSVFCGKNCKEKCQSYFEYVERLNSNKGKPLNGVFCKKVK